MDGIEYLSNERIDTEVRILAAAFKQSLERKDTAGAELAHRNLSRLLRMQRYLENEAQSHLAFLDRIERDERNLQHVEDLLYDSLQLAVELNASNFETRASSWLTETTKDILEKQEAHARHMAQIASKSPEAGIPDDLYERLSVKSDCTLEQVDIAFYRKIRDFLQNQAIHKSVSAHDFRAKLKAICIAHDILSDKVTRGLYDNKDNPDYADLEKTIAEPIVKQPEATTKAPRIGELLKQSEILEPGELQLAVDMHKAMPEMMFGEFMVSQGFLDKSELQAALLAQQLISKGFLNLEQFQTLMHDLRNFKKDVVENLLEKGWVKQAQIDETMTVDVSRVHAVETKSAVPSWANEIDWEENSQSEAV